MTWWKAAGVRALKTVAQTAIATIGTSALLSEVNWLVVLSASALAGILSLLTSIAGLPEVEDKKGYTASEVLEASKALNESERMRFFDKLQDAKLKR